MSADEKGHYKNCRSIFFSSWAIFSKVPGGSDYISSISWKYLWVGIAITCWHKLHKLTSECCNWCKKLAWVPTGMDSFFTIKRKSLECIPKSHPKFSAQERSIFFQVASTAKRKLQKISKRHSERERDLNNKSHELQNFNRETKSIW
jgi:hypothetical protein